MNDVPEHISLGSAQNRKAQKRQSHRSPCLPDGRFISYGQLILKYKVRPAVQSVPFKMGVTVSRKSSKSVDRNFVKRILRETYRHHKPQFLNLLSEGFPGPILCSSTTPLPNPSTAKLPKKWPAS